MKPAILSLFAAVALAVPALAQETPPAPPQDPRTRPTISIDIPEGAFEVSLPSEIKIDNGGVVVDGKHRFMVGRRGPLSVKRVIVIRFDNTLASPGDEAGDGSMFEVGVPKSDSAALIHYGKHVFFVGWRPQLTMLKELPADNVPSVTESSDDATADVAQGPVITEEAKTVRPDPPLSIESMNAANAGYTLSSPAPNPVLESAKIEFTLPKAGATTLTVFDATGHAVATLVDEELGAGTHSVRMDARDLAPGQYLYRINSGTWTATKTMTVVK